MLWISIQNTAKNHNILWFHPVCNLGRSLLYYRRRRKLNSAARSACCTASLHRRSSACTLPSKQRPVKAAHLHSKRTAPLTAGGSYKPAQHSAHTTASTTASAFQNRRWRTRAELKGMYWCTLKSKHRAVRIQLHRRVTVVLPAQTV